MADPITASTTAQDFAAEPTSLQSSVDLGALPRQVGQRTMYLYESLSAAEPATPRATFNALAGDIVPFADRFLAYLDNRFGINTVSEARAILRQASLKKGLGLSSALLSQWFAEGRGDVHLSDPSVFKLCLALNLSTDEAAEFAYDCLHTTWFSRRSAEGLTYQFILGTQELFGDTAFAHAKEVLEGYKAGLGELFPESADDADAPRDITGYTRILDNGLRVLTETPYRDADAATKALASYLDANRSLLTGVSRSALRVYRTYFSEGGVGLTPLTELYRQATGYTLPTTSYLDMTGVGASMKEKRLLWGTLGRQAWLTEEGNGADWDVLNENEIRLEHHGVERMLRTGVLRGNIVALLFFHFCFEHADELADDAQRPALFDRFCRTTDLILTDECGMMPLHPLKPFDRLFLGALAGAGATGGDPILHVNRTLERFYQV